MKSEKRCPICTKPVIRSKNTHCSRKCQRLGAIGVYSEEQKKELMIQCYDLSIAGLSFAEIGKLVGIEKQTVGKMVWQISGEINKYNREREINGRIRSEDEFGSDKLPQHYIPEWTMTIKEYTEQAEYKGINKISENN